MTENTAACIECGAIAAPDARYCETCGAPVMSAAAPPDGAARASGPTRVFDSYGLSGASTAAVTAVITGPFWNSEPAATRDMLQDRTDPEPPTQPTTTPVPSTLAAATAVTTPPFAVAPTRVPVIIESPSGTPGRSDRTVGISAAIPSVANARLALDRSVADRQTQKKTQTYREMYAARQFADAAPPAAGVVPPPPSGPLTPAENEPPWRRIGCLRAITVVLGLNWLVPGVIGLVADGILIRGGSPLGEAFPPDVMTRFQAIVTVVGIVHLLWILIGVKILVAPGRWSVAFTGLGLFVGAIAILFGLSLVHDPLPGLIAGVGAIVLAEVVLGLMAITAAQSID